MIKSNVLLRLDNTGIRREADYAVPINGSTVKLPYLVVRSKETITGSDNCCVQVVKIDWVVALFCKNRDQILESKILLALRGVGNVEVIPFPDGSPYQTTFKFTTRENMK